MRLPSLLLVTLGFAFASPGFAQFVGEFALPSTNTPYGSNQSNLAVGGWTLNLTVNNGSASLNTTGGAGSLVLSATGNGGAIFPAPGGTATLAFSHVATATSTVSFDLVSLGSVSVTLDSSPVSPVSGSSYSFNFVSGSTLAFQVSAMGTMGMSFPGGPPFFISTTIPGTPMTSTLTLSNFASVAAIPEPSVYATLAGALALGAAVWRRRRSA
jgi:hypothetical protein